MNERHTDTIRMWSSPAVGRTCDTSRCVSELLMDLGVAPHHKGYGALRDGVRILAEANRAGRIRTNEDLYPLLGAPRGARRTRIEHAVRDAIKTAWERRGGLGARTDLFSGARQPTSAEVLYTLAERVRDRLSAERE